MELRNITTFIKVAELKSFSKAVEKLGYSQSNVSFQIQQLENELDSRLFERIGKKIEITPQGRSFLFYANEIIKMTVQAADEVRNSAGPDCASPRGQLRIGSIESIATGILPGLLTEFHSRFPHIQVTVFTENKNILIDRINNNQIDMFFDLNTPSVIPNMIRRELRREEIIFICRPDMMLSDADAPTACSPIRSGHDMSYAPGYSDSPFIQLSELCSMPFVLTEYGEGYRRELDALLATQGCCITPVIEFGNPETIIQLVEAGVGMSFLPRFCTEKHIEDGRLMRVNTDIQPIYMHSQMFYHKNKWITPVMQAFFDTIDSFFGAAS